jgi:peptidoglycan/LPS O-acetylase OafA/YrhL
MRGDQKQQTLRAANWLLYLSLGCLMFLHLKSNNWRLHDLNFDRPWMPIFGLSLINFAAAGLILSALRQGSIIYRLTASWPLRQLGRYSYGFYVYHVLMAPFLHVFVWPQSEFPKNAAHYFHSVLGLVLDFALVLAVSVLSYHFVESPFLRLKDRFTFRAKTTEAGPQLSPTTS